MFTALLAWIPLIGPTWQGITSMFTSYKATELGKYQVDGTVATTTIQASVQTLIAFKDDIGVRICRDMIMAPGSAWCGLYLWDKITAHHYPNLVFDVAPLDGPLAILPSALLCFFFGAAALGIWKSR